MIIAILSTTVIPLDGSYEVRRLTEDEKDEMMSNIKGVSHYIGHPSTKEIVEKLGATQAASKLFTGLQPGNSALCFAIKQGLSSRKEEGFTSPHQEVNLDMLDIRILTRTK